MGKNKPFSGIKTKTTIYTIIPVTVTFFIICSVMFISLFNTQRNMVTSEFQSIARRHTANFERKISVALDYLSSVTSVLEFQVYEGAADREALQRIIYYIFDGHTVDSSSIYFEPDMYDGKDRQYIGTVYGTAFSGRISYYFYRFNGRTGYKQAAMDNEIEFSLPYYTDTKELNAATYSQPSIYNIDGIDTLMFAITYPIRGKDGEFIGVITADIFLGDIYSELNAEKIYETGYLIIANDKQQLIYSPRFEDIGKTRSEVGLTYPLPPDDVSSVVFNAVSILNNKRTLVSGQTIYFPQFNSRFYVSVAAPVSEINAGGRRLLIFVIVFSVSIIILIAMFLYYLIGRMTKPLIEFSLSANKIANGDYSVRLTGEYRDEFAVLKDTMNLMTERIENAFNILQNILNGIDAFIYVTEPKTGKILFINNQMKKGFELERDVIGDYCYKVFQENIDDICEFCPCKKLDLNPDVPVVWEEFNPVTKRYYHNADRYIDWIGGSKAHLQHSVDITDFKTITEAKQKAEETSRMKSVFLANMSHEIRTPMNAILGVTEILIQNDELPTEIEEGLDKIYSSCNLLLGIINDILDFSKIEAGKLDVIPSQYKIASMINDSMHLNMMRIDSKPIEFELEIDENIPLSLIGDELRIKQILNNLLSNAFKYTDSGKVTLTVDFEPDPLNDEQIILILSVRDTGHGMNKVQLEQMFDEYSRFNSNITVQGTGLGLAITQRLIILMNGNMFVESEHDKGSYFIVRLPQKIADKEKLGKEIAENLRHFRVNYITHRKTRQILRDPMPYGSVLIVDDVETNIYVAVGLLKLYKLQTETAMSGKEAINKINEGKVYDIIFMDHMMPEMDGIETVKIIRDSGYTAPIIALTANAVLGQADVFLENGFDDFISKPIDIRQLNAILNKLIRDKQSPDVIEAYRNKNTNKSDSNIDSINNENLHIDSLLIESFIRDGKKAVSWMDEVINGTANTEPLSLNDETILKKFTVIVHGMKSSLWNIGENELADTAGKLEIFGKEKKSDMITASITMFTENLRKLLEKLEIKQNESIGLQISEDEDVKGLSNKLQQIFDKADDFDRKGVLDTLAEITRYSKETKAVLDEVKSFVIHSKFEETQTVVKNYLAALEKR